MGNRRRRVGSVQAELLAKSREAVLNAVQTFNNPLTRFKTETFIVLMVIGWMYLIHAYYRKHKIDYRYYDQGANRRRYHRTKSGAYKYWELERCLLVDECRLDRATKDNLRFLIGLRHEIEHHGSKGIDDRFTGRYLACCLNYERTVVDWFGARHGLGKALSYALLFEDITSVPKAESEPEECPSSVAKYVQDFDASLPEDVFQSPNYSYRLLFVRKVTNKLGQADKAIEFIGSESPLADKIDKEYWLIKETERRKYRPTDIQNLMNQEGYELFRIHHNTQLWKKLDAKNPGKGYGTEVVPGQWYWYDRWVAVVRQHCEQSTAFYRAASA
jgi:hypothetical protein